VTDGGTVTETEGGTVTETEGGDVAVKGGDVAVTETGAGGEAGTEAGTVLSGRRSCHTGTGSARSGKADKRRSAVSASCTPHHSTPN